MENKNTFTYITVGMIGLVGFILVFLMLTLLLSSVKSTPIVCGSEDNRSVSSYNGQCYVCGYNSSTSYNLCVGGVTPTCCNSSNSRMNNTQYLSMFSGSAYNSTIKVQTAINIIPDFMQIIVIAIVFIALLGLLVIGGMMGYRKLKGN